MGLVCVTTFRQGSPKNQVERVRADVFVDTVHKMVSAGIPLVVLYIETPRSLVKTLKQPGVIFVRQQSSGMGSIRREVIRAALASFPCVDYLCWLEPEKPDMIRFLEPMRAKMIQEGAALGMFNRLDMSSYPPEQAYYYLFCRAVASQFVGFDLDYGFGPMIIARSVVSYFLEYRSRYGDRWDSILVPRLRIIRSGLRISILPIDFRNDPRMTQVEAGSPIVILKRLEQFNNVVPALITEWQGP